MDCEKLKDVKEQVEASETEAISERIKFAKNDKEIRKFKVVPKKIKRLNKTSHSYDSGVNLSAKHIDLQLQAGNKMFVRGNKKFKFIVS